MMPLCTRAPRRGARRRVVARPCTLLLAVAAAALLLAALALLRLTAALWPDPPPCGAAADDDCPPAAPPAALDVVSVAAAPGCVVAAAVAALNRFVVPRRIVLLAPTHQACGALEALAYNVECMLEDELIPGVTHASVAALLRDAYGLPLGATHLGRDTAGWYLQQLLKLGAASQVANLTSRFVLWDADMIALRPLHMFDADGRAVRHVGGGRLRSYGRAYRTLTGGAALTAAPDGSSFVTHAMAAETRHMRAMLAAFAQAAPEPRSSCGEAAAAMPRWAAAVLCALPGASSGNGIHLGFSEYASYASWTAAHAPDDVAVAPVRLWTRHPRGGAAAVAAQRLVHPQGRCCPSRRLLAATAAQGWLYTGFEVGHVARWCSGAAAPHD